MHYLAICEMSSIKKIDVFFYGTVNPKNYVLWKNEDAITLLIEGVHQFCVKIINKSVDSKILKNKRIVPVQIKCLSLYKKPTYNQYYIKGSIISDNYFYIVEFELYSENGCYPRNIVSKGKVYLSTIS